MKRLIIPMATGVALIASGGVAAAQPSSGTDRPGMGRPDRSGSQGPRSQDRGSRVEGRGQIERRSEPQRQQRAVEQQRGMEQRRAAQQERSRTERSSEQRRNIERERNAERERADQRRAVEQSRERAKQPREQQQKAERERIQQQQRSTEQQRIERQRAERERADQRRAVEQSQERAKQTREREQKAERERVQQQQRSTEQQRIERQRAERERALDRDRSATERQLDRQMTGREKDLVARRHEELQQARTRLTMEQRERFHRAFDFKRARVSNVRFDYHVGHTVPRHLHLYPVPREVITLFPYYRDYSYFVVDDEICIVDPHTYVVVDVVDEGYRSAPRPQVAGLSLTEREIALIRESIPPDFPEAGVRLRLALGATIPRDAELHLFPVLVLDRVPVLRDYRFLVTGDQIVIVEPGDRSIELVIDRS